MDIAIIYSRALSGIRPHLVTVEVHLSRGLPGLCIVGLPETAVKESKERVRSAILNNHFEFPLRRITINLAPADLPKEGGRFDLAIALGILCASGQVSGTRINAYEFIGELALTGELRPVKGILPVARAVSHSSRDIILPRENAMEAGLIKGLHVLPAQHLMEVCTHLNGNSTLVPFDITLQATEQPTELPDLQDVRAQYQAKRALEIAAAGGHNLLMTGPPGTGKTMLAERLPGILPAMSETQALETAAICSISRHGFDIGKWKHRPFRSPHHTTSGIALVGGGSHPKPGEISLAHNGVLFLDELPEFDRKVLEVLREPIESGRIIISRAAYQAEFPADFQLIAAMNPCPCGYFGDSGNHCQCSSEQIRRYRNKISGPLLDRFDIHIEVPNMPIEVLRTRSNHGSETSKQVQERVVAAFHKQQERAGKVNCKLSNREIDEYCQLNTSQVNLLEQAIAGLGLSARAMHRILKVARTIADLAENNKIATEHLTEAITYRRLDLKATPL